MSPVTDYLKQQSLHEQLFYEESSSSGLPLTNLREKVIISRLTQAQKEILSTQYNLIQSKEYEFCTLNTISLLFITKTWFSDNVKNREISLGAGYDRVSRNDRRAGQHGGLVIADTKLSNLRVTDISISDYHFSLACDLHSDSILFHLLIYNPPASSSYHVHFDDLCVFKMLLSAV